jgi:hypothetical protein
MDKLLTTVDRFTTSLKPLDHLLEQVIEKVVPHQKAQACSGPNICRSFCAQGPCAGGKILQVNIFTYQPNCQGGESCRENLCGGALCN